jgi:predicted DNA-binding transcriptional regulator AlpA
MQNTMPDDTQGNASPPRGPQPPRFPPVTFFKGRGYLRRSQCNRYKDELQAFALGVAPPEPKILEPDPFIPLKQVCAELGVGRRTIGRRIKEAASVSEPAGNIIGHASSAELSAK